MAIIWWKKQAFHSFSTEGSFANMSKVPARVRLLPSHRTGRQKSYFWMFAFRRDVSQFLKEIFLDGTRSISQRRQRGFIIANVFKGDWRWGKAIVRCWLEQIVNYFGNVEFSQASI